MTGEATALTPLEIASGLVLGLTGATPATEVDAGSPAEALERAVLPALRRPPCLVSFSGGRDSSAVLAVAAHVARREGLPLPIPATNRFPDAPDSDEAEWQEQVVSDLRLDDWARLDFRSELDCLGPIATASLRRHGLLWPFNAYFHVPLLRLAAGGSLLTGIGGDELLSPSAWARVYDVTHGRARPTPRDVLRTGFMIAPRAVRRRVLQRRPPLEYGWLQPGARRAFVDRWAAQSASEPVRWKAHVAWVGTFRYLDVGLSSLRLLAGDDDVRISHPLLDPLLVQSLGALPRRARFRDRDAGMRLLVGDLLPPALLSRSTKASFDAAFWSDHSRAFAAEWDGSGVDEDVVDVDELRREWLSESPDPRSYTLAQATWLGRSAGSGHGLEQAVDGARQ